MSLSIIRALAKPRGLLKAPNYITNRQVDPIIFASNKMSDSSTTKNQNGIVVHGIRALSQDESKYLKPMLFSFTLNGKKRAWECLKVHDSVACLIFNKTRNKLVYVKQFRPAVYLSKLTTTPTDLSEYNPNEIAQTQDASVGYTLELCAGLVDKKDKSIEQVMQEEIEEETGYKVPLESIKFLSSFRGSTGLSGSLQTLFFCEVTDDQKQDVGGGVDDESIEVIEMDIDEAKKSIFCSEAQSQYSRPPVMLFATSWFLYEYLPKK